MEGRPGDPGVGRGVEATPDLQPGDERQSATAAWDAWGDARQVARAELALLLPGAVAGK